MPSTFKVSSTRQICTDTKTPLRYLASKHFKEHEVDPKCLAEEWFVGVRSGKPGANVAAMCHPVRLPRESGRGQGCSQSSSSMVQWLLYILYMSNGEHGSGDVSCEHFSMSSLKYGNQISSCRRHPCK